MMIHYTIHKINNNNKLDKNLDENIYDNNHKYYSNIKVIVYILILIFIIFV